MHVILAQISSLTGSDEWRLTVAVMPFFVAPNFFLSLMGYIGQVKVLPEVWNEIDIHVILGKVLFLTGDSESVSGAADKFFLAHVDGKPALAKHPREAAHYGKLMPLKLPRQNGIGKKDVRKVKDGFIQDSTIADFRIRLEQIQITDRSWRIRRNIQSNVLRKHKDGTA